MLISILMMVHSSKKMTMITMRMKSFYVMMLPCLMSLRTALVMRMLLPLTAANVARPVESRLCKLLNENEDRLRTLTARMAGVMPETALAVGVDEDGIDVRVSLGVVRVEFPRRAASPEETEGTVRGLLTEIGGA